MRCDDVKKLETYREVLQWASSFLSSRGSEGYAAEWLMKEKNCWTKTDLIRHLADTMPEKQKTIFLNDVYRHAEGTPVQQIIGHEWFYGRKFKVTQDTLIPRPETEELVHLILKQLDSSPKTILDIGTGSGAIACTLKAERPQDTVTAIDISRKALCVAEKNAENLQTDIRFLEGDLTQPVKGEQFDIIVSNPPYIGTEETGTLEWNVQHFEPGIALFAGKEGMDIYRRLAVELPSIMESSTMVFLEIGFRQGQAVKTLFESVFPRRTVTIIKDLSQHDRIIWIQTEN